jgi:hypothetical protein
MFDEWFWALMGFFWVFGFAIIWLLWRRAVEARNLKLREMLHQERLTAIKEGVPLPEIPDLAESVPDWLTLEAEQVRASWLRRLALIVGLVGVTGGLGICAAFYWAPDRGFHGMWTIGFIPILAGAGFLLYCLVAPVLERDPTDR